MTDDKSKLATPENKNTIRIISNGTAFGTKVFCGDVEIANIISVEIDKIGSFNPIVKAKIEIQRVDLDICIQAAPIIPQTESIREGFWRWW